MSDSVNLIIEDEIVQVLVISEKGDPGTPVAHVDLTAVLGSGQNHLSADEQAGVTASPTPITAANPAASQADVSDELTADELAGIQGANTPDADNVFETVKQKQVIIGATVGGVFSLDMESNEKDFRVNFNDTAATLNFINLPTGSGREFTIEMYFAGAVPAITWQVNSGAAAFRTWDEDLTDLTPAVGSAWLEGRINAQGEIDIVKWSVL